MKTAKIPKIREECADITLLMIAVFTSLVFVPAFEGWLFGHIGWYFLPKIGWRFTRAVAFISGSLAFVSFLALARD